MSELERLAIIAILAGLGPALAACVELATTDMGWHVAEDGTELHPGALPLGVQSDDTVERTIADDAVAWWEEEVGASPFAFDDDAPEVTICVGLVPWDGESPAEPAGLTVLRYDADGAVTGASITLSADVAYDRATLVRVLEHELGHCLGLADDAGPPATVDLRSIMSSPLDPLGRVTDADRERLEPYLAPLRE